MSGLSHHPGKVAQGYPCREFESRALRQIIPQPAYFYATRLVKRFYLIQIFSNIMML